jgi:hypothetical protein
VSLPDSITDQERCGFLRKLDGSELLVSDWESRFIESFLQSSHDAIWFTPGRRVSADKMRMKYGSEPEIKMPFFSERVAAPVIPDADPTGCQFLERDEYRRQRPCNAPAAWQRLNGFRYCESHAEAVKSDLKRRGKVLHLVAFKPS